MSFLDPYRFGTGVVAPNYHTLTIAHGMVSGSTKTNFEVWFDVTHVDMKSVANGGVVANANHIRLASDTAGTSLYNYDIEAWDATTGRLRGWVLISSLSSSVDTTLYVAYDDNGITTYQGNRTSVWANRTAVYHLGDGATLDLNDSTATGYTLTNPGFPTFNAVTAAAGTLHGGGSFHGAVLRRASTSSSDIVVGSTSSFSAWIKIASFSDYFIIVCKGDGNNRNYSLYIDKISQKIGFAFTQGSGTFRGCDGTTALSTGTWYFVSATYDGTTMRVFLNGVQDGTHAQTGSPDFPSVRFTIGQIDSSATFADGLIDEVRVIAGTVLDADWWLTETRNQGTPGTYVTLA